MIVFINAIKIPSWEVAKEIFESTDKKLFKITDEILTHLCLNNMASILKTAILSWIKVDPAVAMNWRKYRILYTVTEEGENQELDMVDDSDENELP